jgi:nicotinamide riboside transporter PnuC
MEGIFRYYGFDWLGMFFAIISIYYLGKERKRGFLFGLAGNVSWMGFAILAESLANLLANLVYIGLNCRGFWNWKQKQPDKPAKDAKEPA